MDVPEKMLFQRPERDGSSTFLLFVHKAKSVDFKLNPCKQLEDGTWEFVENIVDPETTGYFKVPAEGKLEIYAAAPKKWCQKWEKGEDGVWVCKDPAQTGGPTDIAPVAAKFGAGGLPKGQVNLGDAADDSFNALW